MSVIGAKDADFRVCRIDRETLIELQLRAEQNGWSTRWTSVEALCGQVREGAVLLQAFLRQERGGGVRTCRCLVLFSGPSGGGNVATIDVDPAELASLPRIDHDLEVRKVFVMVFNLVMGGDGISLIAKD